MTGRTVEYFLTVASPWSYLGHAELARIAARHGATLRCRPLPVRRLFDETGGLPLPKRHPVRRAYRLVELQRWRAYRDLPLDMEPAHPLSEPSLADRVAIAIAETGGDPLAYLGAAMAGVWAEGRNLADPKTIADILAGFGLDGPSLMRRADSEPVMAAYEENLAAATASGVFGAPSYMLSGEVFWGQDRLAALGEALTSGRAPYGTS